MYGGFILTSGLQPNISWCIPNLLEFQDVSHLLMLMFHDFCIKTYFFLLVVALSQIVTFLTNVTANFVEVLILCL